MPSYRQFRKPRTKSHPSFPLKNSLEDIVAEQLIGLCGNTIAEVVKNSYEVTDFPYKRIASYTPDFILPNGVIIEAKGFFTPEDRGKHLLIKAQYPDLDIRFIFENSNTKINSKSKTTYGVWCEQHGFLYSNKKIPREWLVS